MTATTDTPQLFIGGQFRTAAKVIPILEAATGQPLGDGPCAAEADIDHAVAAAHSAEADAWRGSAPDERARVMKTIRGRAARPGRRHLTTRQP